MRKKLKLQAYDVRGDRKGAIRDVKRPNGPYYLREDVNEYLEACSQLLAYDDDTSADELAANIDEVREMIFQLLREK